MQCAEKSCIQGVKMSVQDPEIFEVIIMEVKVTEINALLN